MDKKGGVIDLLVHNYKKIKNLHVTLVAGNNQIGGPNGSGKSSGLDALANIFGGKALTPADPIREGAKEFLLQAKLEKLGLLVKRIGKLNKKGQLEEELIITNIDGATAGQPLRRPQEILDRLIEGRSVVLQSLMEMTKAKQVALLQQITGLDFTQLNIARAEKYEARTNANRDTKRLQTILAGTPKYEGVPDVLISASDLMTELEGREMVNQINEEKREEVKNLGSRVDKDRFDLNQLAIQRASLEQQIKSLKQEIEDQQDVLEAAIQKEVVAKNTIAKIVDADTDEIRPQITDADAINEKVRSNTARAKLVKEYQTASADAEELDGCLKDIAAKQEDMLKETTFPVESMTFDANGVYLNGRSLEQASQVEQMNVDIGVAIAQNPNIPIILINKGSLYDKAHREELDRIAKENGVYVVFERVIDTLDDATQEGVAVYMRNGVGTVIEKEE